MVTLGLFKIKVLLNKGYNVIICVYNVTYKVLLCDSIYVVYVVMQPKFGNSSTSMKEVIKTTFLPGGLVSISIIWDEHLLYP